jgi:hydrogenase expression/formation protein HypC
MCLAIPAKIIKIENRTAISDMMGNEVRADISVMPDVKVGDYILIHAGFAIQRIDEQDAQETLTLFQQMFEKQETNAAPNL